MKGKKMEICEGSLVDYFNSEEKDFTKDGKCSGCGACCTALLPLTDYEMMVLKKYVKDNGIKPIYHFDEPGDIDMLCPFLDLNEEYKKCLVYEARPRVCREYQCNIKKEDRKMFPKMYKIRNLRSEEWGI